MNTKNSENLVGNSILLAKDGDLETLQFSKQIEGYLITVTLEKIDSSIEYEE